MVYAGERIPPGSFVGLGWSTGTTFERWHVFKEAIYESLRNCLYVIGESDEDDKFWGCGKAVHGYDGNAPQPESIAVHLYAFSNRRMRPSWVLQSELDLYKENKLDGPIDERVCARKPRNRVAFIDDIEFSKISSIELAGHESGSEWICF